MDTTGTSSTGTSSSESCSGWEAAVSRAFAPLQVLPHGRQGVTGQLRSADLGGLQVARLSADAQVVHRTRPLTGTPAGGWLTLGLQLSGSSVVQQGDVEAQLGPGDLTVYDADLPFTLVFPRPFRSIAVQLPKQRLAASGLDTSRLSAVAVPGTDVLAAVLAPVVRGLAGPAAGGVTPAAAHRLASGLVELLAAVLSERGASPGRAGLRERIEAHVRAHLAEPALTPQRIARDLHVSVRAVHRAYASGPDTVAGSIRRQRLEACRRELVAHPARRGAGAVGLRWGFTDVAHFTRAFTAEFGVPPGRYRAERSGQPVNSAEAFLAVSKTP